MDYYKCENCGEVFDEFEMNFSLAQIDKKCWCEKCRNKLSSINSNMVFLNYKYTPGIGHYKNCPVCIGECVCP